LATRVDVNNAFSQGAPWFSTKPGMLLAQSGSAARTGKKMYALSIKDTVLPTL